MLQYFALNNKKPPVIGGFFYGKFFAGKELSTPVLLLIALRVIFTLFWGFLFVPSDAFKRQQRGFDG